MHCWASAPFPFQYLILFYYFWFGLGDFFAFFSHPYIFRNFSFLAPVCIRGKSWIFLILFHSTHGNLFIFFIHGCFRLIALALICTISYKLRLDHIHNSIKCNFPRKFSYRYRQKFFFHRQRSKSLLALKFFSRWWSRVEAKFVGWMCVSVCHRRSSEPRENLKMMNEKFQFWEYFLWGHVKIMNTYRI